MKALVSIIINNYNYAEYLKDAIDSAIMQTYEFTEILVIDDGSTDNSLEVMEKYKNNVRLISKGNGGQSSAMNIGFQASKGDIILFLDSDDILLPDAASIFVKEISNSTISKCDGPLVIIDKYGNLTGKMTNYSKLFRKDLLETTLEKGPVSYNSAPNSGNAWSRNFLEKVFPIPEEEYRISADAYLFTLAPLYGLISSTSTPVGQYRVHGENKYWNIPNDLELLEKQLKQYHERIKTLDVHVKKLGFTENTKRWKESNNHYLIISYATKKIDQDTFGVHNLSDNYFAAILKNNKNIFKTICWLILLMIIKIGTKKMSNAVISLLNTRKNKTIRQQAGKYENSLYS